MDTTLTNDDLEREALTLLESVFGDVKSVKLPIDINAVARACDLTIRQGDFIDKDIEGALDRDNRTVFLSERDTFEEKNFATAHEIGHFKLHKELEANIFTMHQLRSLLNDDRDTSYERQANGFAASLLVPKQLLTELWKTTKNEDKLAKIFGVPRVVMTYRIRMLNLT